MPLFREAASNYLKKAGETHGTVGIDISIGEPLYFNHYPQCYPAHYH